MPTEELAKKAVYALSEAAVDANFYWYTNNWHYINGWEHLRNLNSLSSVNDDVRNQLKKLNNTDFSKSDAIMSRTISSLIKFGWSENEVRERALNIKNAISSVL